MITTTNNIRGQKLPYEFYGLSTDIKPAGHFEGVRVINGSYFFEIDTGKIFIFDEQNQKWYEQ